MKITFWTKRACVWYNLIRYYGRLKYDSGWEITFSCDFFLRSVMYHEILDRFWYFCFAVQHSSTLVFFVHFSPAFNPCIQWRVDIVGIKCKDLAYPITCNSFRFIAGLTPDFKDKKPNCTRKPIYFTKATNVNIFIVRLYLQRSRKFPCVILTISSQSRIDYKMTKIVKDKHEGAK